MKIKTNYESLVSVLNLMNLVTSGKKLQEDIKVVNIFVQTDKLYALGTDAQLFCLDTLEGEYDLEGESNPFMVIHIKEIMDILSKFSSLQRTQVKEIKLESQQKGIVMTVTEEPKVLKDNAQFTFSDMYKNQESRFKLVRTEVRSNVVRELATMVMPDGYSEVKSKDLQKYLDYMYPPMTKPKETAVMHFDNEFVYSVMGNVYGIAMPNMLPKDIFSGLSLPLPYINFLRNVIPQADTFKIYKDINIEKLNSDGGDGDWNTRKTVTLMIQINDILVKLRVLDNSSSVSTSSFKQAIKNTVEVDKPYFLDTLKRLEGFDQVFVEISIHEDDMVVGASTADFIVKTQRTRQRIPVKCAHGSGDFKFMLRPESLSLMAFSHLTKDIDGNSDKINDLIFCLDNLEKGAVSLTCRDKSDDWQTRYPKAPYKEAPQLDF